MEEIPQLTYLGHSGFIIEYENTRMIIDPQNKSSGNTDGDLVYCTHNHFDHIGGVNQFLERNETAKFVCGKQTASKFAQWDERIEIVEDGDTFEFSPFTMKIKYVRHGLFKSVQNLGVIIQTETFSFAHCGDAVEIEGLITSPTDVLAIPIFGGFTASPGKAIKLIEELPEPKPTIIPMHWMFRNPKAFCKKLTRLIPDVKCIVPVDGEQIDLLRLSSSE